MSDVLLDTHVLLWWTTDDARLSLRARAAVAGADRALVSDASLWELAVKASIGKIRLVPDVGRWFATHLERSQLSPLPIDRAHLAAVEHLPLHHRDPFDRLLVCQAHEQAVPLVSADGALDAYGVPRIW